MGDASDTPIEEQQKGPFGLRKLLNKVIKKINRQKQVVGIDTVMGSVKYQISATNEKLDFSQLQTMDITACDSETGEQMVIRVFGARIDGE